MVFLLSDSVQGLKIINIYPWHCTGADLGILPGGGGGSGPEFFKGGVRVQEFSYTESKKTLGGGGSATAVVKELEKVIAFSA